MVRDRPTDRTTDIANNRAAIAAKKLLGRLQKSEKVPIVAKLKTKDVAVLSHNQSCNSSLFQSQLFRVCRCYSHVYYKKYCHSHDQRASLESTLQNENAQDMILNSSNYS